MWCTEGNRDVQSAGQTRGPASGIGRSQWCSGTAIVREACTKATKDPSSSHPRTGRVHHPPQSAASRDNAARADRLASWRDGHLDDVTLECLPRIEMVSGNLQAAHSTASSASSSSGRRDWHDQVLESAGHPSGERDAAAGSRWVDRPLQREERATLVYPTRARDGWSVEFPKGPRLRCRYGWDQP